MRRGFEKQLIGAIRLAQEGAQLRAIPISVAAYSSATVFKKPTGSASSSNVPIGGQRLAAMRGPRETYSDVILRLAEAKGQRRPLSLREARQQPALARPGALPVWLTDTDFPCELPFIPGPYLDRTARGFGISDASQAAPSVSACGDSVELDLLGE
jgi:hypothetical protein